MAAALVSKVTLQLDALFSKAVGATAGLASTNLSRGLAVAMASGVGANQADLIFAETRTIAASGNSVMDLAGTLVDVYGSVITFARIKAIAVFADAGNTNNVLVGAAAATQFLGPLGSNTDTINVRPGGAYLAFAPDAVAWAVGAGTTDFLKIANSGAGTGVTYDIVLIGASA